MLLQLFTTLASTREFIMRRQAIIKADKDINIRLSKNKTFLKFKLSWKMKSSGKTRRSFKADII